MRRGPQPGQLTPLWRVATVLTWALVLVAWSGVWKASRELGVATWWLGPDGEPQPVVIMLLPFVVPLAMVVLLLNNLRRMPWCGLVGAALAAVLGIIDLSYVRRLGIVELVIAGAAGAVSLASFTGVYRRVAVAGPPEPEAAVTATLDPPVDAPADGPVVVELEGDGPNTDGAR